MHRRRVSGGYRYGRRYYGFSTCHDGGPSIARGVLESRVDARDGDTRTSCTSRRYQQRNISTALGSKAQRGRITPGGRGIWVLPCGKNVPSGRALVMFMGGVERTTCVEERFSIGSDLENHPRQCLFRESRLFGSSFVKPSPGRNWKAKDLTSRHGTARHGTRLPVREEKALVLKYFLQVERKNRTIA